MLYDFAALRGFNEKSSIESTFASRQAAKRRRKFALLVGVKVSSITRVKVLSADGIRARGFMTL
jgi:hypothetical protein